MSKVPDDVMTLKKIITILPFTEPLIEKIITSLAVFKFTTRHLKARAEKKNSSKKA